MPVYSHSYWWLHIGGALAASLPQQNRRLPPVDRVSFMCHWEDLILTWGRERTEKGSSTGIDLREAGRFWQGFHHPAGVSLSINGWCLLILVNLINGHWGSFLPVGGMELLETCRGPLWTGAAPIFWSEVDYFEQYHSICWISKHSRSVRVHTVWSWSLSRRIHSDLTLRLSCGTVSKALLTPRYVNCFHASVRWVTLTKEMGLILYYLFLKNQYLLVLTYRWFQANILQ